MPYEQPAEIISAGALTSEGAAELLKPHRKAIQGDPKGDTSKGDEHESDESEEREDTADEEELEDEVEGETEHADDEESSEDEKDEEHEEDEEEPDGDLYEVKVDGKVKKVTLDELRKGYSFTAHNTRRAQDISAKEAAVTAKETEVAESAKAYAIQLQQVKEALATLTPKEPTEQEWDTLYKKDPAAYVKQKAAWDKHKEGLTKLDTEQKEAIAKVQAAEQKKFEAHLASENEKLLNALPAWKDPKVRTKEVSAMTEFGKSLGFSEDELSSVTDSRAVLLLRNAYKYAQAQKVRPDVEKRIAEVRTLTPGSSKFTPGRLSTAQKAVERLEKSGTVEDAVAALQAQRAVGGRPRRGTR